MMGMSPVGAIVVAPKKLVGRAWGLAVCADSTRLRTRINGNSNSRDFLFVAVGNFNGFRVVFRPAFDMNTNGDIPLK